jgi:hypothetical protein
MSAAASRKTQAAFVIKANLQMRGEKIMGVCFQNHTKHTHILCWRNTGFFMLSMAVYMLTTGI